MGILQPNFGLIGIYYSQDFGLIGTKPIGHNWIQLDFGFQLILDLIGLDWTFSQRDQIGSNWTFVGK